MKDSKNESTKLAGQAMNRAARKVFQQAVDANEPIPLWNGKEVVWKIPVEELKKMQA
ncbi:MAG: hypothetical protein PF692_10570 [Kiritimatiellae bacterium]|jgi:hypothetical protein|nr:hypothetical protein [Kiritimatiellia bacterium]